MDFPAEPFKIKVVEPLETTSLQERSELIRQCGFNLFSLPARSIFIDLLTDSGTSAMSDNQWAGMMLGDESYAGSRSYLRFEETVHEIFGFRHIIPTHQGRMAENILFSVVLKEGDIVPNNTHFDTTRANVEHKGGRPLDLIIEEGLDPTCLHPFKGNMNVAALEKVLERNGPRRVPLVMVTVTNNSAGGQPVSMENLRQVRALCDRYGVPLFLDACRFAENCFLVKEREKGYQDKPIPEIARELFSLARGCTMSAKKDGLVNIGGFLAMDSDEWAQKATNLLILIEGFSTYGGLAGRDLEAMARGFREVLNEDYLRFRINQVRYLGEELDRAGIPILKPVGGHAVYLDARKFLPHIPAGQFPGQALAVELYRQAGIRSVEIGSLMFAHQDPETGELHHPALELVRLAIPRRVYTTMHINYVVESVVALYQRRQKIRGLRIVSAPRILRHFTAVLEEIE